MFNRDTLTVKKDEKMAGTSVNVTPGSPSAGQTKLGGLTGAYAAPTAAEQPSDASGKPLRPWEEQKGSRLVVGPDIKLKGVEISDCDTLFVEGRVEASLDARVVQVAETGVFAGTASMDVAEIWGRFEGELTARKHLIIHGTGRVSGIVHYGSIQIDEGGQLSGTINTLQGTGGSVKSASSEPPRLSLKTTAYEPVSPAQQTAKDSV
jgi:cytoskeletal protein CcmA (bactofilin family)